MDQKITKEQYKDALSLMSHLILTKPKTIRNFLSRHGVKFSYTPKKEELVSEIVELLAVNDPSFIKAFDNLIDAHITQKKTELAQLTGRFNSFYGEDEFLGAITAGLGIAKGIGGLFKKKRRSSSSPTVTRSTSYRPTTSFRSTSSSNSAIASLKASMDRQMQQMKMQQLQAQQRAESDRRRREDEDRRRRQREEDERRRKQREEDDRRRKEKEKSGKNNNQILIIGGALLAVTAVIGVVVSQRKAA